MPRSSLPLSLGALFLVLALLAREQYRQAGELSNAERVRMRAWAKASAESFCRDFDQEVTLAFLGLRLDPDSLRSRDFGGFAERHAHWKASTRHPGLVKDVLLVETGKGAAPRLGRYDAAGRTFSAIEWPAELAAVRARVEGQERTIRRRALELARGDFVPGRGGWRVLADAIVEQVPALVSLVPPLPVTVRDGPWRGTRLPLGLVPPAFEVVVFDLAYARERLLPFLAERYFGSGEPAYNLAIVSRDDASRVYWRSSSDSRVAGAGDASAGILELRLKEAVEEDASAGRWRLVATHRAGSVDAVVSEARLWNLGVGFGILVLLGTSAALVVVSAQRASDLAIRQMEFVAGVSHELRTPIAVISSAAENLADGLVGERDQVRRYGSVLRDEARRLAEMVEQVLQFGAAGRGGESAERIAVEDLVERSLEACSKELGDGSFVVERHLEAGLPELEGDAAALSRALRNLLGNALKHARDGRYVAIRAAASADRSQVLLSVEDRGRGIPDSELPHVFESFFRGQHARRSQVRGFGLGLALVSRVAEAHGGSVDVTSSAGRGSTFTLRLPVAADEARELREEEGDGVSDPAR